MTQTSTIQSNSTTLTAFVAFANQDDQPIFVRLERPATGETLEKVVPAKAIRLFAEQLAKVEEEEREERIQGLIEIIRINEELGLYDGCYPPQ